MKVYLAGKIGTPDWRSEIVGNTHTGSGWRGDDFWVSIPGAVKGGHEYVGPFFYDCGHGSTAVDGCWFGRGKHGNGIERQWVFVKDDEGDVQNCGGWISNRERLHNKCCSAIAQSDVVFAWLDGEASSAYGTFVELGFAYAKHKDVVIGIKSSVWTEEFFNDFWFGLYVTSDVITNCEFAGEAWNIALSKRAPSLASMPYQDYLQTDHWKATSKAAKERASHRCQVCNKLDPHLHTHHRTYVRRGAEREDDLIVLCAKCHSLFHANGKLAK